MPVRTLPRLRSHRASIHARLPNDGPTGKLRWSKPAIPAGAIEIDLADDPDVTLQSGKFYVVHCTSKITSEGGVVININGAIGVVTEGGGRIELPTSAQTPDGGGSWGNRRRAIYLYGAGAGAQIFWEGYSWGGLGCAEGFDHDNRLAGTVTTIQNCRGDEMYVTTAEATGWPGQHPDCFQTWGGPTWLRFDKFTGYTPYQGMFFQPVAYDSNAKILGLMMDRVNIVPMVQSPNSDIGIPYQFNHDFPMYLSNVWGKIIGKNPVGVALAYKGADKLSGQDIIYGVPPGGDFVTASSGGVGGLGIPGLGYISPGYLN